MGQKGAKEVAAEISLFLVSDFTKKPCFCLLRLASIKNAKH
jgi:hypothetical protein